MGLDTRGLKKESVTQGASTDEAKLAGMPGQGTLQVWRGQKNDVIGMAGTWRTEDDSASLEKLREARDNSSPVRYEGVVDDPAQGRHRRVSEQVIISSIGSYPHRGHDGRKVAFVNFKPHDPQQVLT